MGFTGRGMPPEKEAVWKNMFKKEDYMKLKWFHKNQKRLMEVAEKESAKKGLSPEVLAEVEKMRQERYRNMERFGTKKGKDPEFPDIDPHCIMNVMKPIDPKERNLLYTNMEKEGRKNYLKARYTHPPEDRYYFPETTSFAYGWHIMEATRSAGDQERYGHQQVIKNSFYRRNGSLRQDPEFYRCPQRDSPTVCGCI